MKIQLGTILHIVINLAESNAQIPVIGQVVWNRPIEGHSSGYYVGVSFVKIFKKHREIMQRIVDKYSAKNPQR